MGAYYGKQQYIRTSGQTEAFYESRIARVVEPSQPELARPLKALADTTSDCVEYRSIGCLGISLVMLEPALRQILGQDKKGMISEASRRDFELEINEVLGSVHGRDREFPLDNSNGPLALFGKNNQKLAIKLPSTDVRLRGDRELVREYIEDVYPAVTSRFGAVNVGRFRPHITIGRVRQEKFSPEEREDLYYNTTEFMLGRIDAAREADIERFAIDHSGEAVVFPESVVLSGLEVVCVKQTFGAEA